MGVFLTNNVRVEVESQYAPEHSQPFQNHWFFYYTVRITNEGDEPVQLLSRHWLITDADGKVQEVRGLGVVGNQPLLQPLLLQPLRSPLPALTASASATAKTSATTSAPRSMTHMASPTRRASQAVSL